MGVQSLQAADHNLCGVVGSSGLYPAHQKRATNGKGGIMIDLPDPKDWDDLKKYFNEALKEVPEIDLAIVTMRSNFDQLRQFWQGNGMTDAQVGAMVCYAGLHNMRSMPFAEEAKLMIILMALS